MSEELMSLEDAEEITAEGENFSVTCTHGKIGLWFGRKADGELVKTIIFALSKADPKIKYEFVTNCDYDLIYTYENNGFVLTSYARSGKKYRAVFNIPFSRMKALKCLIEDIAGSLESKPAAYNLLWSGNDAKIKRLLREVKDVDGCRFRKKERKKKDDKKTIRSGKR